MFRAVHTPIIRSTGLTVSTVIGTLIGQAQIVSGTASQCSLVRTASQCSLVRTASQCSLVRTSFKKLSDSGVIVGIGVTSKSRYFRSVVYKPLNKDQVCIVPKVLGNAVIHL